MGATTRNVVRDIGRSNVSELEQEVFALRQELRLLQLANEELEQLVARDTLTPLYNRRHFINGLSERLSRLARYGAPSALIFIDVNAMKQINDNYGHGAGDFALIHIARLLAGAIRSADVAARVGGDEFALLLDGLDEKAAQEKAAQLAKLISETECRFNGTLLPLSIAVGCTALRKDDSDFSAIARADMAMYTAKPSHSGD